jgi:hypothetical protein
MTCTPIEDSRLPECPLGGYVLRQAGVVDLPALLDIERRCMKPQVEAWLSYHRRRRTGRTYHGKETARQVLPQP